MAIQSIFDPLLKPQVVTIETFNEDTFDFGFFEIDATISENHSFKTELTQHEVEEGFDVTDNARKMPRILNISGVITDTPNTLGSNKILNSILEKPSQNAYDFLLDIYERGLMCYISTSVYEYAKYIMTDFTYRKSLEESGGLFFDLTFEEVRFAEAKEGQFDDVNDADKSAASSVKKKGTQKTTEATPAQAKKGTDLALKITGAVVGN